MSEYERALAASRFGYGGIPWFLLVRRAGTETFVLLYLVGRRAGSRIKAGRQRAASWIRRTEIKAAKSPRSALGRAGQSGLAAAGLAGLGTFMGAEGRSVRDPTRDGCPVDAAQKSSVESPAAHGWRYQPRGKGFLS